MIAFDHVGKRASAEWLTSVLTANGFLRSGEVVEVNQRVSRIGTTLTSEFFLLQMRYSPNHEGNPPADCLMKIGKPELFGVTSNEAAFYERARRRGPKGVLLTCFGTAVDEPAQSAVILLEVKRDTRPIANWPALPEMATCEQLVRVLATVHASWWNSTELDTPGGNRFASTIGRARSELLQPFFDEMGDGLSRERRTTLEQMGDRYPFLLNAHIDATQRQTLAHGDAHFWNFLYPNDATASPLLIDWQACLVQFGAWDLAYMIGSHFDLDDRRRAEASLLNTYLLKLYEFGIDYRYDDLWYDYRLLIAGLVFVPIAQRSNGVPTQVWRHYFDHAFSAFDDLGCRDFLQ
jgi:hypothetical protein